jgi:3-deoxy-7-phosphoheptulonate synthase
MMAERIYPEFDGLSNRNILWYERITATAEQLKIEFPMTPGERETIIGFRQTIEDIYDGIDPRGIAIVGGCSVHDLDEARKLIDWTADLRSEKEVRDSIFVVLRMNGDKPRTLPFSWRGMIVEPDLDGIPNPDKGLRDFSGLLKYAAERNVPVATEYRDSQNIPKRINRWITAPWIGSRNCLDSNNLDLASGLTEPVGIKNPLSGNLEHAVEAVVYARDGHINLGETSSGDAARVATDGNDYAYLMLRGGEKGPNYSAEHVAEAQRLLKKADVKRPVVLIDCNHGNSGKDPRLQPGIFLDVFAQRKTNQYVIGGMMEVYLNAGNQPLSDKGRNLSTFSSLKKGLSVTDCCISTATAADTVRKAAKMPMYQGK